MRGTPAGKCENLETLGSPPIGSGIRKSLAGTGKSGLAQRRAGASEHIGQTLRAQVGDKTVERAEADLRRAAVDHRIGKARTLEQLPAGTDIDGWMDAGGRAVAVGRQHGRAQYGQAACTHKARDHQPAGRQRIAQVNQRTGQVVDRVECRRGWR